MVLRIKNAYRALVNADYYSFAVQDREGEAEQKLRIHLE